MRKSENSIRNCYSQSVYFDWWAVARYVCRHG